MRSITAALLVAATLGLAGCMSSNVEVYSAVDQTERTVTVPFGNKLLVGAIKQRLAAAGWKMSVDRGLRRTVGTVRDKIDVVTADTFHTRYRLVIGQGQFDYCIPMGGPAINYDLSLVDNDSGEEVLTQSGKDCQERAADKFMAALTGKVG